MEKNQKTTEPKSETKKPCPDSKVVTTYHEEKIRGTLYRVTSVYLGKFELGKALEDLTIRKVLSKINSGEI